MFRLPGAVAHVPAGLAMRRWADAWNVLLWLWVGLNPVPLVSVLSGVN